MQLLSRFFRKRSADNTDAKMKQLAKLSGARLQQAKVTDYGLAPVLAPGLELIRYRSFARAFSDAIFIPNADDRLLMEARLAKLGMTWEEAVRSPVWNKKLWRRVRRWIPPPGILEPLVREVFEKLAKRCLEAIRKGQVSDPVGIELYTDLGPCGGPDGKADDGVRLYSCQRGTNSLEGGIHRNLRQRFPKSGVSPCHANACLADYVLVHNLTVSPTPPSQFEEAATILTHYPLYSQVGTSNRTGKPFVGHYGLWLTVELHRLRRKTSAFFPRHSTTVSDIVNLLLYTPSTETFGIVLVVQSPTAQMRFLIEPYQVERGTLRLEPVKWSPRNLLQNNTPAIQHMQSRLPTDRKLRHDWPAKRQGTRFAVLYVHTPSERALYRYLSSKVRLGAPQNLRIFEITEPWNKYANGLDIFYKMPEHINTWAPRWSSLANAQATMITATLCQGSVSHHLRILIQAIRCSREAPLAQDLQQPLPPENPRRPQALPRARVSAQAFATSAETALSASIIIDTRATPRKAPRYTSDGLFGFCCKDLTRRFRLARTDPLPPVNAIAVLPTHAGSRAVLATHVPFWAFTVLSRFPTVDAIAVLPTRELTGGTRNACSLSGLHCVVDVSLPASMAAFTTCRDRCVPHSQDYFPADEVADREFHLAGRSQLLAARYETLDVARLEQLGLPIVIPPTIPVYHQEFRTLLRLDQFLAVFPRRPGFSPLEVFV
ncbi:BQ5605_C010g06037 [Microbotryum silenes-dioicae]|uniref:BQ5605_C010g06037 protein n=1 Tax=Microbotryum silenes-dioicae TaxID=796604 RepID=A0A2X0LUR1_9BASI|nr:BQ5605_C010g06037 [Microbotryum silenes-dioicae]